LLDRKNKRIRRVTSNEIAQIQSFPSDWFDIHGLSTIQKIQAIGNAVPPRFAHAVMLSVHHYISSVNSNLVLAGKPCIEFRSVELCAGGGGLALGSHWAGFETVGLYDFWSVSTTILRHHGDSSRNGHNTWKKEDVHLADVASHDFSAHRGVAVLTGGPPCQPFSTGGKSALGEDDERDLFKEMPRVISQIQPEVFVLENVPGLAQSRNKTYYDRVLDSLKAPSASDPDLRYNVYHKVYKIVEFGVPQTRRRLLTFGTRIHSCSKTENSILWHVENERKSFSVNGAGNTKDPTLPFGGPKRTVGEILDSGPDVDRTWMKISHPTV
jgi:site-specific DNA-cytosine methylase